MTTTPAMNRRQSKKRGRPLKTHKTEDYAINYQAYLMMQLFGNGISGIDTMLGMLGIAVHSGSHSSWDAIANQLGVAQQKVASAVQETNLLNEIEEMKKKGVQPVDDKGRKICPLTCTYDMGWQKRASGNSYNSQSGHGFLVGCYTNKVIDCICYSRGCHSCLNTWKKQGLSRTEATKDEPTGEINTNLNIKSHRCPRNFNGSAKSMEACGALLLITRTYNRGNECISILVGDDDSTTRSNCKHSIKEVMAANGWTNKKEHWPKNAKGKYVADNGKLGLNVRAIDKFLADPSHRGKSFGRAVYKVEKKRGRELKFTSVDCERLKRNFNFWQRQNRGCAYDVFKARYRAVLDHHFGDHSCCQSSNEGGWCKYKNCPDLIKESKQKHCYRDITVDNDLYKLLLKVWEHFGSETMLEQVFHHFSSQKK